jgi:hypothetical protein
MQQASASACAAMHDDLALWGKILLQGAKGDEPHDDEWLKPLPKRAWTAGEESAAWATDTLVRTLPPREQAILRTFYRGREAEYWHELGAEERAKIETDMCREFNYRWRMYCAETQQLPVTLRGYHFGPLREAAIRRLAESACNSLN